MNGPSKAMTAYREIEELRAQITELERERDVLAQKNKAISVGMTNLLDAHKVACTERDALRAALEKTPCRCIIVGPADMSAEALQTGTERELLSECERCRALAMVLDDEKTSDD